MNLIDAISQVGREKGIDKDVIIDVVKSALRSASKKSLRITEDNVDTEFDETTGEVKVFLLKKIVKKPENSTMEISLEDAQEIDPNKKLNEDIKIFQQTGDLTRISAQLAKQLIIQKVREAEKESVFKDFKNRKGEVISAVVSRFEKGDIFFEINGKIEGLLPKNEQAFREKFKRGEIVKAYLIDVKKKSKGPQIILSRTHPGLLIKLFSLEVPEIAEDIIEIKNAVREPNGRSKIAVKSNDKNIDAVGACVGVRGVRVQAVVTELRGEKIDIVEWDEDPVIYVTNALKPSKISRSDINEEQHSMEVVVSKDQLSLAIGKNGQNVRLAARLCGWKIDIKPEGEELKTEKMEPEDDVKVGEELKEENN